MTAPAKHRAWTEQGDACPLVWTSLCSHAEGVIHEWARPKTDAVYRDDGLWWPVRRSPHGAMGGRR